MSEDKLGVWLGLWILVDQLLPGLKSASYEIFRILILDGIADQNN
jgi:hypothetical protein